MTCRLQKPLYSRRFRQPDIPAKTTIRPIRSKLSPPSHTAAAAAAAARSNQRFRSRLSPRPKFSDPKPLSMLRVLAPRTYDTAAVSSFGAHWHLRRCGGGGSGRYPLTAAYKSLFRDPRADISSTHASASIKLSNPRTRV